MDYRRTFCRRSNRDQEPPMNIFMIEYYIFLEIFFKVCDFRPQGTGTVHYSVFLFQIQTIHERRHVSQSSLYSMVQPEFYPFTFSYSVSPIRTRVRLPLAD